jgi:P27 family predicted phage terminase small subunit
MGRRGPPPAPTKLKLLRGETRPSRVNYAEPEPLRHLPEQPTDLIAGAAVVWGHVLSELGHTGTLTGADRDLLRVYVETVVRYEEASVLLATSGPLIVGARRGDVVRNPLTSIVRDLGTQLVVLARELGLSPSARSGIRAPSDAEPGARLATFLAANRRA